MYWATNSSGTSSKVNLEPFETYGDTILKFASTWISYEIFKNDPEAGENEICERRNWFLTNKELYRLGIALNLRRYLRTIDGDTDNWVPPLIKLDTKIKKNRNHFVETKYTGKNLADWVEALIAAYMLSGGVKHALTFIAKIGAVPLDKYGLLDEFPDKSNTIDIMNLDDYNLKINAKFEDVFKEYQRIHKPKPEVVNIFKRWISNKNAKPLGYAYREFGSKYFRIN